MLRRSGDSQDIASDESKLADLKKRLLIAIEAYLRKAETKTVKVSIANPESFRLHVMRGEEGVARAKRYQDFIVPHDSYNALVEKLIADIKDAVKTQEANTLKAKTTEFLSWGYEYTRAKISGYMYPASSENEAAPRDVEQPLSLGNSEALTLEFARVLCQHLDLNPRNAEIVKELSEVNPEAAKAYEAAELKRIIAAIDKFMESSATAAYRH